MSSIWSDYEYDEKKRAMVDTIIDKCASTLSAEEQSALTARLSVFIEGALQNAYMSGWDDGMIEAARRRENGLPDVYGVVEAK